MHEARYLEPWEIRYQIIAAETEEEFEAAQLDVSVRSVHSIQFAMVENLWTPVLLGLGSRRGGKSRTIGFKTPASCADRPGVHGEIVSPTYAKSQIMWRYVLDALPPEWIVDKRENDHWIELVTGTRIKFVSAHNPDSLIGEGVGWLHFDELQSIKEQAWSLALPSVSDGGKGFQIVGVGTPRMGEFKQRYERIRALEAQESKYGPRAKIYHFTYRDNVYIESGDETIFGLSSALIDPRTKQQDLDAEFVSEEGLVYYRFDRKVHDKNATAMRLMHPTDITGTWLAREVRSSIVPRFVIGVDYGVGRNYAVIYRVLSVGGRVCLWATAEAYRDRDYDVDDLAAELIARKLYPAVIIDDASGAKSKGGQNVAYQWEDLRVKDGHIVKTDGEQVFEVRHYSKNPHVADRVNAASALMGNSLGHVRWWVNVDSCPRLVECLENQEFENGKPKRSGKNETKYHDMPDAMGYPCVYLFPSAPDYEGDELLKAAA